MSHQHDAEYPPPHMIAAADQEFAAINAELDQLIAAWKHEQPRYRAAELDTLASVCAFMTGHLSTRLNATGAYAALAVAIDRLTKDTGAT